MNLLNVTVKTVRALLEEEKRAELLTLFKGADVDESQATAVVEAIQNGFPQLEVELKDGRQLNDYFLLMLE